jgi:hypothetical protein
MFGDEPPALGGSRFSYSSIASSHGFLYPLFGRNGHMQHALSDYSAPATLGHSSKRAVTRLAA